MTSDAGHGDSIAVNGVCLTVVEVLGGGSFTADVMAETLNRSSLGAFDVGSRVNLERAAALNSRLGGHIVQGHVDGTGPSSPVAVGELGGRPDLAARHDRPLRRGEGLDHRRRGLADGVRPRSDDDGFEISLIPTTLELTTLGGAAAGTPVNLEVDVIAKYVERLQTARPGSRIFGRRGARGRTD